MYQPVRILTAFFLSATAAAFAQDPPPPDAPPAAAAAMANLPGGRGAAPSSDPQPYEKVITKEAKTTKGVFLVHQIKDRYYYEIPKSELGPEFLWNTRISKTTNGVGYGGDELTDHVIRWELNGNKVHMRDVNYGIKADPKNPVSSAVKASNNDTILMTFPVAAFSKDGAPVIEITRLFTTDVPEFGLRQHLNATAMDASRSYIERISPYPTNIEAESSMTFTRMATPAGLGTAPTTTFSAGMRPGSATIVAHHSMVKLPEKPMLPRLSDDRVGFFTHSTIDYSTDEHRASRIKYIAKWRLEKKDPSAELSEPVKPLVYYVDSATPPKWREWIKKGIEDWQVAFEAAGFKNAIIGKYAPTPAEDPNFSNEDMRNTVIRWLPSTIENAVGPHIADPRTGEILNGSVSFYHNIMNLQRDWYFVQAGPLDPRAAKLPLPDDLMGRLLEFVVAHEVGHTLGFQHNMKASSMYPQEKVRDAAWVHKMGHAPSIMDYSRFNYVAQPEDKIPVADLVPRVGPYDVFATKWGYTPIAGAKTSEEERPKLDEMAREQDKTPWLRFSTAGAAGSDFGELTEAVGDADAIKSSAMGLKNLQRVAKMLMSATTAKNGESYEDLAELYGRMLGQWTLEMNHVGAIVGSVSSQTKYVGQDGRIFTPTPKARQQAAVAFLNENVFATPKWAVDPEILRRIEPVGVLSRVRNAQNSVLNSLLASAKFARLVEQEAIDGPAAYSPVELLGAVRKGIFTELDGGTVKVDAYRRNLQRAYLDLANTKINSAQTTPVGLPPELAGLFASSGDERPFYREELRTLNGQVSAALAKASDRETRAHLEGVRDQIARILDPKFASPGAAGGAVIRLGFDEMCWPDYVIRP